MIFNRENNSSPASLIGKTLSFFVSVCLTNKTSMFAKDNLHLIEQTMQKRHVFMFIYNVIINKVKFVYLVVFVLFLFIFIYIQVYGKKL